jgi:cysteine desulfurase
MFVRRGTPIESLLVGGSHERRQRAGTENVPGIVGLAKAAELAMHSLEDGTISRLAKLRDRLEAGVLELPGTGVNGTYVPQTLGAPSLPRICFCGKGGKPRTFTGHVYEDSCKPVPRVANTTNIWFDNLEGEALVIALDLKGVAVSGGSAKTRARASLRLSLLKTATEADVDYVLKVVPEAVEHLRAISPVAAGTAG